MNSKPEFFRTTLVYVAEFTGEGSEGSTKMYRQLSAGILEEYCPPTAPDFIDRSLAVSYVSGVKRPARSVFDILAVSEIAVRGVSTFNMGCTFIEKTIIDLPPGAAPTEVPPLCGEPLRP